MEYRRFEILGLPTRNSPRFFFFLFLKSRFRLFEQSMPLLVEGFRASPITFLRKDRTYAGDKYIAQAHTSFPARLDPLISRNLSHRPVSRGGVGSPHPVVPNRNALRRAS